jgi:hypothetical protein
MNAALSLILPPVGFLCKAKPLLLQIGVFRGLHPSRRRAKSGVRAPNVTSFSRQAALIEASSFTPREVAFLRPSLPCPGAGIFTALRARIMRARRAVNATPATRVGSVPGARSAVTRAVAGREIGAIDSLSSVDSDNETLPSPGRTAVRVDRFGHFTQGQISAWRLADMVAAGWPRLRQDQGGRRSGAGAGVRADAIGGDRIRPHRYCR